MDNDGGYGSARYNYKTDIVDEVVRDGSPEAAVGAVGVVGVVVSSTPMDTDFVGRVIDWNKKAGNTTDTFNTRQSAMYLGLQCEELAEKLMAVGLLTTAQALEQKGKELKKGVWDNLVHQADLKELLDGDCDLIVVSIGAAMSQGANVHCAMNEILRSNESKCNALGLLDKDQNGKIIKPPHYSPPDLTPFVGKKPASL